jgi:hypothetical protein
VDDEQLDPIFWDFSQGRAAQKHRFMGEFFPAQLTGRPDWQSVRRILSGEQSHWRTERHSGNSAEKEQAGVSKNEKAIS